MFLDNIKKCYFSVAKKHGDLAQLARAFGWQPKGQGFDSPNLHDLEIRL